MLTRTLTTALLRFKHDNSGFGHLVDRLFMTRVLAIYFLALVMLYGPLDAYADDVGATDRTGPPMGDPNMIDTVYFSVTRNTEALDSQGVTLNFWARGCPGCTLSGLITPSTELQDSNGRSIPVTSLLKGKKYEAVAIVYAAEAGGLIKRIILSRTE